MVVLNPYRFNQNAVAGPEILPPEMSTVFFEVLGAVMLQYERVRIVKRGNVWMSCTYGSFYTVYLSSSPHAVIEA